MSIICKTCNHEVHVSVLVGYLLGQGVKLIGPYAIAYYIQSRNAITDHMIGILVGLSNTMEVKCAFCGKHEGWEFIKQNEQKNDFIVFSQQEDTEQMKQ